MPIDPKDLRSAAGSLLDPRLVDTMNLKPVGTSSLVSLEGKLGVFTPVAEDGSGADNTEAVIAVLRKELVRLESENAALRRQLAEEGATFRKILEQCRMRAAAHYLRRTNAFTLSEIAFRIGYSDQSNFTRAFSRWAGVAPNAWRRTVASDDPASH